MPTSDRPAPPAEPRGITAIGIFFCFAALMAALAGTTLVWRGTVLDRAWALNAPAYAQLAPLGRTIGIPFLIFSVILLITAVGWLRRRRWGWYLGVAIIVIQLAGDLMNLFLGWLVRGGAGVVIAGLLLIYMLRPRMRAAFQ
jgi:uncharacterized membrane protein (DUF2068 family)